MKGAISISQPEPVLSLYLPFVYQNGSRTYGGPRTSADRIDVSSLLYILSMAGLRGGNGCNCPGPSASREHPVMTFVCFK